MNDQVTETILLQEIIKSLSPESVHHVYVVAKTLAQIEREKEVST